MSIYGRSKTSLTLNALAGKPQGYNALHFMIPLNFPLQVAGSFSGQFVDLTTVPPSQIAQEGDGDIHVEITVVDGSNNNAPVDISAATVLTLLFKKPDLTTQSFVAHLVTNGRDGKMGYNLNKRWCRRIKIYT